MLLLSPQLLSGLLRMSPVDSASLQAIDPVSVRIGSATASVQTHDSRSDRLRSGCANQELNPARYAASQYQGVEQVFSVPCSYHPWNFPRPTCQSVEVVAIKSIHSSVRKSCRPRAACSITTRHQDFSASSLKASVHIHYFQHCLLAPNLKETKTASGGLLVAAMATAFGKPSLETTIHLDTTKAWILAPTLICCCILLFSSSPCIFAPTKLRRCCLEATALRVQDFPTAIRDKAYRFLAVWI